MLAAIAGVGALFAPLIAWLVPGKWGALAAGAWLASVGWMVVVTVVLFSGTASQLAGDIAEQWSAQELEKLRRTRWRSFNGLSLTRRGDIDHVAVGPGGVVLIETKWRSDQWDLEDLSASTTTSTASRLAEEQRSVRLWLKRELDGAAVNAVIAAWGAVSDPEPLRTSTGVTVLNGSRLSEWVSALPQSDISDDQIERICARIQDHMERRDREAAARGEAIPEPYGHRLQRWGLSLATVLLGFTAGPVAVGTLLERPALGGGAAIAVAVVLFGAWRWQVLRSYVECFIVGVAGSLLLIAGWALLLVTDVL